MSTRKTKQDWVDTGIDSLKNQGPMAISAEKLAKKLGVTRGSFYHHFANIGAFNDSILDYWENTNTTTPFLSAKNQANTTQEELEELVENSWHTDIQLEVSVRTWASSNPQVAERVAKIDQYRMAYITALYQVVVGDAEKGKRFAQIAIYGLLGAIHAQPRLSEQELGELVKAIQSVMMNSL